MRCGEQIFSRWNRCMLWCLSVRERKNNFGPKYGKFIQAIQPTLLFDSRLEYFSVMFNILLVLIYLFTDGLSLIGWHIPNNSDVAFRVCVTLKLLLWSFVFLNLLPFKFLIPTLYGRKFFIWLNSIFLLWYGSCIWNSVSFEINFKNDDRNKRHFIKNGTEFNKRSYFKCVF